MRIDSFKSFEKLSKNPKELEVFYPYLLEAANNYQRLHPLFSDLLEIIFNSNNSELVRKFWIDFVDNQIFTSTITRKSYLLDLL